MEAVEEMSLLRREIRPIYVVLILSAIFLFLFLWAIWPRQRSTEGLFRVMCASKLKQLALAHLMYSEDYDEMAIPATKWQAALMPYLKNEEIFRCPKAVDDSGASAFGYAFNAGLSMKRLSSKDKSEQTICFFETNSLGPNVSGGRDLVANPGRHIERSGFAYLDGHAKMVKDGADPGYWALTLTR